MPKDLRNSTAFPYKYTVKKSSKGKMKTVWELVQRREFGRDPALVNRWFSIPAEKRSQTGNLQILWMFHFLPKPAECLSMTACE